MIILINEAWKELKKIFGPNVYNNRGELEKRAKKYAEAILEMNDTERIQILGKKHLNLVSERKLTPKQLDVFLTHAIIMEGKMQKK